MGKGDIKTRRGKIARGSHGNKRPKRTKEPKEETAGEKAKAPTK